jgi:hypothetical protein
MSVQNILETLDREIANLTQVRNLLAGLNGSSVNGTAVNGTGKRAFSAAARRKMAIAQKARWAKHAANGQARTARSGRVVSASARRKMAAAQKRRWAAFRAAKKKVK